MSLSVSCCKSSLCCHANRHTSHLCATLSLITTALLTVSCIADKWLYTTEVDLTFSREQNFSLGIFRLCTHHQSTNTSECQPLYGDDSVLVTVRQLGVPAVFTVGVAERIRWVTPVVILAVSLTAIATLLSLTSHCHTTHCTHVAAALLVLSGLVLGGALLGIVNIISEEFTLRPLSTASGSKHYLGECFYVCTATIFLAQITALILTHSRPNDLTSSVANPIKFAAAMANESSLADQRCELQSQSETQEERAGPSVQSTNTLMETNGFWIQRPIDEANSRTLPSRGRYAKQVTFKLEEISLKANGPPHVRQFNEPCTLPRFMNQSLSSNVI